jgi:hypothetical protein
VVESLRGVAVPNFAFLYVNHNDHGFVKVQQALQLSSYAVLCCAVLCCAVLCYAVLCCAVLCCAPHSSIPMHLRPCSFRSLFVLDYHYAHVTKCGLCLPVCLSVHLSVCLHVHLSVCLSVSLVVCTIKYDCSANAICSPDQVRCAVTGLREGALEPDNRDVTPAPAVAVARPVRHDSVRCPTRVGMFTSSLLQQIRLSKTIVRNRVDDARRPCRLDP